MRLTVNKDDPHSWCILGLAWWGGVSSRVTEGECNRLDDVAGRLQTRANQHEAHLPRVIGRVIGSATSSVGGQL